MDKIDIISQIEEELTWRFEELVFFKNQLSLIEKEEEQNRYRKSLVVMLYSYYEGFCKSAFQIYIQTINLEQVTRADVNLSIRTSSLHEVFLAVGNDSKRDSRFKKELPEDSKLHKYSRQATFVNEFTNFLTETVNIPESIVDTESNLKAVVLKKILYRLGFPFEELDISENTINKLLGYRNAISHGSRKRGITEPDYEGLESNVKELMNNIRKIINEAIRCDSYLETTR
ncbi:MAE_28990/MAE_18760 family HEPN-like nuclease [Carnobacterium pleistocenium]|uniref:MAE_28990/MAE_18760 family HEPN-like nuclease n=1 Tax=Carnobacterium pleistocenium TaxID=181073 RepID=UPI00054E717E|nr:MAE_28990/MAE_18760 family HEPN-like nuclease [Carnobacterium pleistocenium]